MGAARVDPTAILDALVVGTGIVVAILAADRTLLSIEVVYLLVALTTVNLLDLVLPQGDTADIDSAFLVAALAIIGLEVTVIVSALSIVVARTLSGSLRKGRAILAGVARRFVGIAAAAPIFTLMLYGEPEPNVRVYAGLALAGGAFVLAGLLYAQFPLAYSRMDSPLRMALGNVQLQASLLASSVCLAVLIVVIYAGMGAWSLFVVGFLLMAIRHSYSLLLDVRGAYRATLEVLTVAMEAKHPGEQGVGEELAALARRAGAELGWFGTRVENLGYAAFLYYFGLEFSVADGSDGRERPTQLESVGLFKPVQPIVGLLSGRETGRTRRMDAAAAYVIAKSMDIMGMPQEESLLASLRSLLGSKTSHRIDRTVERARIKTLPR